MNPLKRILSLFRNKQLLVFLLLFSLIFVRYSCFGFEYYHQLDDYIQYHNYAQSDNPFAVILNLGLLAARPLAGISDIFIWSLFFGNMIIASAILSAMYAVSALLLRRVFSHHFHVGFIFLIVFTLLPLGIEGTYWISAASRSIPGLFFASASLFFFSRWCISGKPVQIILFALFQLICFGFYEQALIFSVSAVLICGAFFLKKNKRRAFWCLISFVNTVVYFLFTLLFRGSAVYENRLGFVLPFGHHYSAENFPNVLKQVYNAFIKGGFYTLVKGAWRGSQMLVSDKLFLYSVVIIMLCCALFRISKRECALSPSDRSSGKPLTALFAGFLLALAPVTVFFVINNAWFSLRCTVMSFCGIAIIADTLLSQLFKKLKHGEAVTAFAVSCFALIFCVASVSEIRDYRDTTENDNAFIKLLAQRLETDERLDSSLKLAVFNVLPSYLPNQNFFYHEHIHGVTESDWALTGALESYVGINRPSVTPIPKDPAYQPWNIKTSRPDNFDALYIYLDGTLREVRAEKTSEDTFTLYDNDTAIAYIREEDNYGYLRLSGAP